MVPNIQPTPDRPAEELHTGLPPPPRQMDPEPYFGDYDFRQWQPAGWVFLVGWPIGLALVLFIGIVTLGGNTKKTFSNTTHCAGTR